MSDRLLNQWETFRLNFWFIPVLLIFLTLFIAAVTLQLDATLPPSAFKDFPWLYTGSTEGSMLILSTIAGAMMTVAGLVFSITFVALTLTSSQYGHRLLRTFISDTGNQLVIGTFICTFIYCLIILRTMSSIQAQTAVPHISVTTAGVFALISLGMLVYYFHHATTSLQVDVFIARMGQDLIREIKRQYPKRLPDGSARTWPPEQEVLQAYLPNQSEVPAKCTGYIQYIDYQQLLDYAKTHDLIIKILDEPGQFVAKGKTVAQVFCKDACPLEVSNWINKAFIIGPMRNISQDVKYGIDQIVELALRALSPAINSPFTAIECIDWLGAALAELAHRDLAPPYILDITGKIRIIPNTVQFIEIADGAFNQIRQFSYQIPSVSIRLLDIIYMVSERTDSPEYKAVLFNHAEMIVQGKNALQEDYDREALEKRFELLAQQFNRTSA